MTAALALVLAAGFVVAVVNGANDVSKGIATLVGSGVAEYRRAIRWGTLFTALGSVTGASLASAMVSTFGNGLLAAGTTPTFAAGLATIVGAAMWVLIATRTGLPVSTTHAIVGAIAGVGTVAYGLHGINWVVIGDKVVLPLLLSPVVALTLAMLLFRVAPGGDSLAADAIDCVCVGTEPSVGTVSACGAAAVALDETAPYLTMGSQATCAVERPAAFRVTLDHAHWLTSGATSFARGMNDAPKMVALMLAAAALSGSSPVSPWSLFALVTAGMVVGSIAGGRRVTHVLAERVTRLDHQGGFLANLVTAVLVGAGAVGGLPMSTTHVSSGAIIAAGADRGSVNWGTVREMLLAWVVTLPGAAILGMIAFAVLRVGHA